MRRVVGLLVAALAAAVTVSPAALADAGNPNYRSKLLSVKPAPKGLTVRVVDGDDALRLSNATGKNVMVPGYEGEPYLRFLVGGRVEVNLNSPAKYLNEERYGAVPIPKSAKATAKPRWQAIASGGSYTWHEHRIHWMSTVPPPRIKQSGGTTLMKVFDWTVPLKVGVGRVKVSGTLWWVPTGELERADALIAAAAAKTERTRPETTTPAQATGEETVATPSTTEETADRSTTESGAQAAAEEASGSSSAPLVAVIAILAAGLVAAAGYVVWLRRRSAPASKGEVW